jgi:MraZ protein
MAYFSGEYECKVDPKGRLVLPARVKAQLPEGSALIYLTRGFEQCLVVYSETEWRKVFSKVAGLSEFNEEYRNFQRNFLRGNTELELDASGRILLPRTMLKYADIDKDAIVVGVGTRVEIWNPDKYNAFLIADPKELSRQAEKLLGDHLTP